MNEFIKAFVLITLAEMGDKTQLLALAFASKFRPLYVLTGIFIGAFLNHGLAIALGNYISRLVPIEQVQLFASLLFIFFGLWSLRLDIEDDEDEDIDSKYGPILTVAFAFFIGELGDKTQLTAMTLGANSKLPLLVLLGTVTGMIVTGGLGILVGKLLGKKIPEVTMKLIAAFVFMFFGTVGLYTYTPALYITPVNIVCYFIILILLILLIFRLNIIQKDRYYEEKLALVLIKCRNCGEGHIESCPINQERVKIENEYLGENVPYVGSVIKYLESLKYMHVNLYEKVHDCYKKNRD